MAQRTAPTEKRNVIVAWIADKNTAGTIPNNDLDTIQRKFKGSLEIVRMRDGGIAIYTEPDAASPAFVDFMESRTPFKKQKLDRRNI